MKQKKWPVLDTTGFFFRIRTQVTALVRMAYIFTLLMLLRQQLTKIKRQIFIGQRPFDSRLYLDIIRSFKWKESFIFRYFKVFQSVPNVHLWSVWFVITCGWFVSCFCIARIHFKSSHTRQSWTYIMPDLKYLYRVLYFAFLNKLLIFLFNKANYQKSYILIIVYSSVVTVAEWLDGSFESQSRRDKRPTVIRYPKVPKYA